MSHRNMNQASIAGAFIKTKVNLNYSLKQIDSKIKWSRFKEILDKIYSNKQGRPSYPPLIMFKCLLVQNWYNLSDYGLEEALDDRLSFRSFIGLELDEYPPEHSTISRFLDQLIRHDLERRLFSELDRQMQGLGLLVKLGTLIDATIVSASVSRPLKKKDGTAGVSKIDPEAEWTCKGKRRDYY